MNMIICAICGATLQTSGDVCAEAAAKGWEVMDGGARCKKCRMAGTSGKFREIPGNSRLTDAEIDELEKLAGEARKGPWRIDKVYNAEECYGGISDADGCTIVQCYVFFCPECGEFVTETGIERKEDAEYIAAANPAAVLSLVAEVRAARAAGKD